MVCLIKKNHIVKTQLNLPCYYNWLSSSLLKQNMIKVEINIFIRTHSISQISSRSNPRIPDCSRHQLAKGSRVRASRSRNRSSRCISRTSLPLWIWNSTTSPRDSRGKLNYFILIWLVVNLVSVLLVNHAVWL